LFALLNLVKCFVSSSGAHHHKELKIAFKRLQEVTKNEKDA
jgi:hypothetical protein